MPGATFLAGAAAAATGILAGWRWAFVTGAAVAALVAAAELVLAHRADVAPTVAGGSTRPTTARASTHSLRRMVVAGALGSVANNAMRVFFVESAVAHGQSLAAAGTILGIGSIAGIVTRLVGGWRSDRSGMDPVRSAGVLMVLGLGRLRADGVGRRTRRRCCWRASWASRPAGAGQASSSSAWCARSRSGPAPPAASCTRRR